jgi:hypothetical protein
LDWPAFREQESRLLLACRELPMARPAKNAAGIFRQIEKEKKAQGLTPGLENADFR